MKILAYAACIKNFAALNVVLKGGLNLDPFKPPRFAEKTESDAWISAQQDPEYYTSLPILSLRDAAHTGVDYFGRPLRTWGLTLPDDDLGMPEPIESSSGADPQRACSAAFFLEGADFDVIEREVNTDEAPKNPHRGSQVFRWVLGVLECLHLLFPKVTVEMLILVCGSYQLHMEIERRAHHLRKQPGWNTLTEGKRLLIARCVQQYLINHLERLSLLLPPDHLLVAQNLLPSATVSGLVRSAPPEDNVRSEVRKALVEEVGNTIPAPPKDEEVSEITPIAPPTKQSQSGKKKRGKGRPPLLTEDEKNKAWALKQQGITWPKIAKQLRPGSQVSNSFVKQIQDSVRHHHARSLEKNRTTNLKD